MRDRWESIEDGKQELERRGGKLLREESEPWLVSPAGVMDSMELRS